MTKTIKSEAEEQSTAYELASDTLGKDMLGAMIAEIKALPDVWQKMAASKQEEVIYRLRTQVEQMVLQAVGIISGSASTRLTAEIESIAIKNGVKAVMKVSRDNASESLNEFFESSGEQVFIVLANVSQFTGAMDDVKADPDQCDLLKDALANVGDD